MKINNKIKRKNSFKEQKENRIIAWFKNINGMKMLNIEIIDELRITREYAFLNNDGSN